tara:strand:- start:2571 stop:2858 length:288 start_codon:yes stop_codon:yes gene_type:complete
VGDGFARPPQLYKQKKHHLENMANIKCTRSTFCGGLFLEEGAEYEVSTDDAIRLVAIGKAEMIDARPRPAAKKRIKKAIDAVTKKKASKKPKPKR